MPHSLAAQADDALPKAAVAKRAVPSAMLEDFLPRAVQTSLAATQVPSASFQMLLNDLFTFTPSYSIKKIAKYVVLGEPLQWRKQAALQISGRSRFPRQSDGARPRSGRNLSL
jgi:hypothetical protein